MEIIMVKTLQGYLFIAGKQVVVIESRQTGVLISKDRSAADCVNNIEYWQVKLDADNSIRLYPNTELTTLDYLREESLGKSTLGNFGMNVPMPKINAPKDLDNDRIEEKLAELIALIRSMRNEITQLSSRLGLH